jgi:hypothetical protein
MLENNSRLSKGSTKAASTAAWAKIRKCYEKEYMIAPPKSSNQRILPDGCSNPALAENNRVLCVRRTRSHMPIDVSGSSHDKSLMISDAPLDAK